MVETKLFLLATPGKLGGRPDEIVHSASVKGSRIQYLTQSSDVWKQILGKSCLAWPITAVMDLCPCFLDDTSDFRASQTIWGVYGSEFKCVRVGMNCGHELTTVKE
jgi:hypothetical protein